MTFVANTAAIDLNQYIKDPAKTNPNYTAADNRLSVDAVIHRYRTGMPSMIGVGMAFATPPPRTVRAVFPHTALQLVVSSSGLSR